METPPSLQHHFDPRLRIVCTLLATTVFLALRHHAVLLAIVATLSGLAIAHPAVGARILARRLVAVNLFAIMLVFFLPWSTAGTALIRLGFLTYTWDGLLDACRIGLKANAVVLAATLLLTPVEPILLGHAVAQLGAPHRLVQLYVLTLRYLRVLDDEYRRLVRAMRMRNFRARANLHTLRTFGYLVGMLLIRALDRAERIWQAMLCRGYTGVFPPAQASRLTRGDLVKAAGLVTMLAAVFGVDRLVPPW